MKLRQKMCLSLKKSRLKAAAKILDSVMDQWQLIFRFDVTPAVSGLLTPDT